MKDRTARNSKPIEVIGIRLEELPMPTLPTSGCWWEENCRDVWSYTETTSRRRGQALQRYQARFCASEVLAWCWSTTVWSGLEVAVHGKGSVESWNSSPESTKSLGNDGGSGWCVVPLQIGLLEPKFRVSQIQKASRTMLAHPRSEQSAAAFDARW